MKPAYRFSRKHFFGKHFFRKYFFREDSFRQYGSSLVAAIFFAALACLAYGQQETYVDGLWAHENTIVLLARFDQCGGPYRPVQPIVSTDGGQSWKAEGPRLDGAELLYMMSEGDQLWIAGQMYAEGPTNSPFLLTYNFDLHEWSQSDIYSDAADLLGLAREKETGHLLAWVEHLEQQTEYDSGPIVLHESVDGGQSWGEIKNVEHVPTTTPRLRFFRNLPRRSGKWQVANAGDALEQVKEDGQWHRRVKLPLRIQRECPEIQDDTRP